jgi:hypothetical protein
VDGAAAPVPNRPPAEASRPCALAEEAREARQAPAAQLPGELADVLEVLQALAQAHGGSWTRLQEIATRKRTERGAFNDRIFLEYAD